MAEREGPPTPTPLKHPPIKGPSGQHPIMKEVRARLDSLADKQLPGLIDLNERIERLKQSISTPPEGVSEDEKTDESEECPDTLPEKKNSEAV